MPWKFSSPATCRTSRWHRSNATTPGTVLRGKLSGLERKTAEPIARQAGQVRRPLQLFVGNGRSWFDRTVLGELRGHVREELGGPDAVWVLDGSAFPKLKGDDSSRRRPPEWCGRLGPVDNACAGFRRLFLAYAAAAGLCPDRLPS